MSTIRIRRYASGDERAVRGLIQKILDEEFPEESQAYSSDDLNDIEDAYGKLGEAFFVAEKNGEIIGTVGVKRDDERTALLRRLFVKPDARKQRLGERLVKQAVEFAHDVGYDELIFKTTSTMKQAVKLGKKKGFVPKAKVDVGPVQLLKFALNLKRAIPNHG